MILNVQFVPVPPPLRAVPARGDSGRGRSQLLAIGPPFTYDLATLMNQTMTDSERAALLALCVMAAYADGEKGERERAEVKRIFEGLEAPGLNPVRIYQEALADPPPIAATAARLQSPAARAMAYEMAVCVCEADDLLDSREKQFLEQLRAALELPPAVATDFQSQADAIAAAPVPPRLDDGDPLGEDAHPPPLLPAANADAASAAKAEENRMILNYAILNGALELLPQSLATMAIIPLQMKMVYRIGRRYGFALDRGHVRDFLGTVGVGLTSQVVEGYARKLLGGLLGKVVGGQLGRFGRSATAAGEQLASSAFSFASTYALGQVARQYYAGGRTFAAVQLKSLFSASLTEAKALHGQYLPQIQERLKTLRPAQLLPLIQGKSLG